MCPGAEEVVLCCDLEDEVIESRGCVACVGALAETCILKACCMVMMDSKLTSSIIGNRNREMGCRPLCFEEPFFISRRTMVRAVELCQMTLECWRNVGCGFETIAGSVPLLLNKGDKVVWAQPSCCRII